MSMAVQHEYWSFIPPPKIYTPQNKFLAMSLITDGIIVEMTIK